MAEVRSPDIVLPADWAEVAGSQQQYIVRWLLSHQPAQRPTSQQLLQSDWLPPPLVEEAAMQSLVSGAMANTSSKAYKVH